VSEHDNVTPSTADADGGGRVSRRAVAVAAAWSVPVIAVAVASPAYATSAQSTLTVDIVKTQIAAGGFPPADSSDVVVTVRDSQGRPWAGQPVTLTASPAGVTLAVTTGTTDAAGQFTTTLTAPATAGLGVYTVVASSDVLTASDTTTVVAPAPARLGFTVALVDPVGGWAGPDASGRVITTPGSSMRAHVGVRNTGGLPQAGYTVSITMTYAAATAAVPTISAPGVAFTYAGSVDSVSGGQNRRTYTYSTTEVLDPGETHAGIDIAWTTASNAAIRALPLINASDYATVASVTLRFPDGTSIGTNTLRTGSPGADAVNWIIRTTA
jgi:hypothetical protein